MSKVIQRVERESAGIVLHLGGEIDLHQSPKFHQELVSLCKENPQRLILDLSKVQYIDSSGVGSLVEIYRRLKKDGGSLVLVAPSERVQSVLEITRLDQFFTIATDLEEAKTS